jgi:hypothetical protein
MQRYVSEVYKLWDAFQRELPTSYQKDVGEVTGAPRLPGSLTVEAFVTYEKVMSDMENMINMMEKTSLDDFFKHTMSYSFVEKLREYVDKAKKNYSKATDALTELADKMPEEDALKARGSSKSPLPTSLAMSIMRRSPLTDLIPQMIAPKYPLVPPIYIGLPKRVAQAERPNTATAQRGLPAQSERGMVLSLSDIKKRYKHYTILNRPSPIAYDTSPLYMPTGESARMRYGAGISDVAVERYKMLRPIGKMPAGHISQITDGNEEGTASSGSVFETTDGVEYRELDIVNKNHLLPYLTALDNDVTMLPTIPDYASGFTAARTNVMDVIRSIIQAIETLPAGDATAVVNSDQFRSAIFNKLVNFDKLSDEAKITHLTTLDMLISEMRKDFRAGTGTLSATFRPILERIAQKKPSLFDTNDNLKLFFMKKAYA